MKKVNALHILLEVIVILGNLVIGITALTFMIQKASIDRVFVGSIVLAIGVIEFTDFFTWKYATKIRSIQSAVAAVLSIALGLVFIFVVMNSKIMCILWGAFSIAFSGAKIATAMLNMAHQPLLNAIKTILLIVEIVFSIVLIISTLNSLYAHVTFVGIALIIEAVILLIEFMVHRYQQNL